MEDAATNTEEEITNIKKESSHRTTESSIIRSVTKINVRDNKITTMGSNK